MSIGAAGAAGGRLVPGRRAAATRRRTSGGTAATGSDCAGGADRFPAEVLCGDVGGAPLVFLHGLLETNALWHPVVGRQGPLTHPAVALPLPGHAPDMTAAETGAWLCRNRFLDAYARTLDAAFPGEKWRLVGHSTGGLVALELAWRFPGRVQDILLVGTLFSGQIAATRSLHARLAALPLVGHLTVDLICRLCLSSPEQFQRYGAMVQSPVQQAAPLPDGMRRDLARCNPRALRRMINWVRGQSVHRRLPEVSCPVTSIVGTRDPVVPPEHQLALLRALPDARAMLIDTGHLPFFEAPARFDALFRRWLIGPEIDRALARG